MRSLPKYLSIQSIWLPAACPSYGRMSRYPFIRSGMYSEAPGMGLRLALYLIRKRLVSVSGLYRHPVFSAMARLYTIV